MFKVEAVVVGAGVVGLAIARALALRGIQMLLLEKEIRAGGGTSSRSSEVIHAGLYYEPSSLKAALCVPGRRLLYRYCRERGVPHRQCGKLVVATEPGEDAYLGRLLQRAEENGVENVAHIGAAQLKSLEPDVKGTSALVSGSTGIVDSHALMLSYQADAEAAGATVAFRTPVLEAAVAGDKIGLVTGERETAVAKGNYFTVSGARSPFRHLIYPVPEPGGLGIHLTFDLGARFVLDLTWSGSTVSTMRSIPAAGANSKPRSAATGPACPTGCSVPLMPASGRRRPRTAPPIS
jgi:L-2-hydroxyglutarate oxidase LhgO